MSTIDRFSPTTPASRPAAKLPPAVAPQPPATPQDTIKLSVDARVKLGKDRKPEVVVDGVQMDGVDVSSQVAENMRGRSAGLRAQVTRKVVDAISQQVAQAVEPVLEQKFEQAFTEQQLSPQLAHQLAEQAVPKVAAVVAERLAEQAASQAKVSYHLGL